MNDRRYLFGRLMIAAFIVLFFALLGGVIFL